MNMNETTYTPAPWNMWVEGSRNSRDYSIEGVGEFHIPNKANARLIAAAPDLLSALEDVVFNTCECHNCNGSGIDLRTDNDACADCGGYGFNPCGDIREAVIDARAAIAKAKGAK